MSATYIGVTSGLVTSISYKQRNDGIIQYTKKLLYLGSQPPTVLPSIGDIVDNFSVVGASLAIGENGFSEVIIQAESSPLGGGAAGGFSSSRVLVDAANSTSEEPIASAINFNVETAGLPSIVDSAGGIVTQGNAITPETGSIFTENGEFVGFTKNAKKNLFGVQSYLNPSLSHKRRFSTNTKPSISAVGRIVNPATDFPEIEEGRTWLCTNISYVQRGDVYEVSQEFRSSGRQGWNTYIYGPPISAPALPVI